MATLTINPAVIQIRGLDNAIVPICPKTEGCISVKSCLFNIFRNMPICNDQYVFWHWIVSLLFCHFEVESEEKKKLWEREYLYDNADW